MGILILLISMVVLLWGIWPQETVIRSFQKFLITPSIFPFHSAIPENRTLVLEWSPRLRVGDVSFLRVKLDNDQEEIPSPTTDAGGGDPGVEMYAEPNLPPLQNVIVEARLDMAGMQYAPSGEISESLRQGQPLMFLWSVRAPKIGIYRGTVWLHVRYLPLSGEGEIRKVLSAPRVETESINFLGLGGTAARIMGSVGLAVGVMLGLDGLWSWFWNLFTSLLKSSTKS
jgi:hypothetical protein